MKQQILVKTIARMARPPPPDPKYSVALVFGLVALDLHFG